MARRKKKSVARLIQATPPKPIEVPPVLSRVERRFVRGAALRRVVETAVAGALFLVRSACNSLRRVRVTRRDKVLVVRDTVSLGEKRFLAVVEVGGERYLIGGAANSVALLASLREQGPPRDSFSTLLEESAKRSVTIQ